MKLQAVMENLHRQQRAKLLMELEQQQQQQQQHQQVGHLQDSSSTGEELKSPSDTERAQMAALAAMRAVAAGLQRHPTGDSPLSQHSSVGDEDEDEEEEGEERYKDVVGSEEEEQM